MKNLIILLGLLGSNTYANSTEEAFKELEHQFYGCPMNSVCSKKNGELLHLWESLFKTDNIALSINKAKRFLKKNGVPVEFLIKESETSKIDSILFKSRCSQHNPKKIEDRLNRSVGFFKRLTNKKHLLFDEVKVFHKNKFEHFRFPYQEQPSFINNGKIYYTAETNGVFYLTGVSKKGYLSIENANLKLIKMANNKKVAQVDCPLEIERKPTHMKSYCQKIWNFDSKKLVTIQVDWSCP
jgi:hypothetical protein